MCASQASEGAFCALDQARSEVCPQPVSAVATTLDENLPTRSYVGADVRRCLVLVAHRPVQATGATLWSVQTFTSCTFIASVSPPPRLLAPHGPNPLMCDRYDVLRAGACFFQPAQAHPRPWHRSARQGPCQCRLRDLMRPPTGQPPVCGT